MKISVILHSALLSICFISTQASGAVVVTAPTALADGSLQITEDIIFTMTTGMAGSGISIVMDQAISSPDGTVHGTLFPGLEFALSFNGGVPVFYSGFMVDDSFSQLDLTANDSYFGTSDSVSFAMGDTVTVKAATYVLQAGFAFNPQSSQTFTGVLFVTDSVGNRISNFVALPEPSSALMGAMGAGLLLGNRRRRSSGRGAVATV